MNPPGQRPDGRRRGLARGLLLAAALALLLSPLPAPQGLASGGEASLSLDLLEACPPHQSTCFPLDVTEPDPCALAAPHGRSLGVTARVIDGEGHPVEGAHVHVHSQAQEATFTTQEDGRAHLGILEAEGVEIEAHHQGESERRTLTPTWGSVEVELPEDVVPVRLDEQGTVEASVQVAGTGPALALDGSLTVAVNDEHRTLELVGGTGSLTLDPAGPRVETYEVIEADVCALPLAGEPTFQIDWYPTTLGISPSPLQLPAVDPDTVSLETTGIGPDGQQVPVDAATEIAWSTDPAGLATVEGDELTLATTTAGTYTLVGTLELDRSVTATVPLVVEPGPLDRFEIRCEQALVGGLSTWCHAEGVDVHGNEVGVAGSGWSATRGQLLLTPDNGSVLYEPPAQGGEVTLQVDHGDVTGQRTLQAADTAAPELELGIPTHPRAGRTTSFQLTAEDPSGIGEITWSVDGHVQRELDGEGATEVTERLEHRFPTEGFYDLAITATDTHGHTSTLTTRVLVLPLPAHGAPRLADRASSEQDPAGGSDDGATSQAAGTERVVAQASGSGTFTALLEVNNGRTPWASTPDGTLEVRITTSQPGSLALEMTPSLDRLPRDPIYRVLSSFDLSVTGDTPIEESRIRFTVPAGQLAEARGSPEQVRLLHWDGEAWDRLPTRQLPGEDPLRFQALTDGFSPFAVVLEQATSTAPGLLQAEADPVEGPADRYRAIFEAGADGQPVRVLASDGRFLVDLVAPGPGSYTLDATLEEVAPAGTPSSPTEQARFLALSLRDDAGQRIALVDATVELRLAPGEIVDLEPRTIVVAEPGEHGWAPVDAVVEETAGTTVAWVTGFPAHPLAFLVDDQAPEVGLTAAPPATLIDPTEVTVVARDNVAVGRIVLHVDGQAVQTLYERPYTFTLDPDELGPGVHNLTFQAVDLGGNEARSPWQLTVPVEEQVDPAGRDDAASAEDATPKEDGRGVSLGGSVAIFAISLALLVVHLQARRGLRR